MTDNDVQNNWIRRNFKGALTIVLLLLCFVLALNAYNAAIRVIGEYESALQAELADLQDTKKRANDRIEELIDELAELRDARKGIIERNTREGELVQEIAKELRELADRYSERLETSP